MNEQKAFIYGFFYGDGSCGKRECKSRVQYSATFYSKNLKYLSLLKECLRNIGYEFKIYDAMESSKVNKLSVLKPKKFIEEFRPEFYDKREYKKIPEHIIYS